MRATSLPPLNPTTYHVPFRHLTSPPPPPPSHHPLLPQSHAGPTSSLKVPDPLDNHSSSSSSRPHLQDDPASSSDNDPLNGGFLMKNSKGGTGSSGDGRVVPAAIHQEATEVLALPDVRDGLKLVHRRILYAMHQLGLFSKKPSKKCATVVFEVLGKFHPDGIKAIYDALVGMAQDFSLRYPLIQRRGNFGHIDAHPLAAMRRGKCRLQVIVVGLDNLAGVIDIIGKASSNAAASTALRNGFNLSEKQAEAILDVSLRKPTLLERNDFVDERKSLMEQISKLKELLSSRVNILQNKKQLSARTSSPLQGRSTLEDSYGLQRYR